MDENLKDTLMYLGIDTGLISLVFSSPVGSAIFWATAIGSVFFSIMTIIYGIKSAFGKKHK